MDIELYGKTEIIRSNFKIFAEMDSATMISE